MSAPNIGILLENIVNRWREYRASAAALQELIDAGPDEVESLARDCGISAPDLMAAVAHGAGADRLMERMMAQFHIDREKLQADQPDVLREVEILCSVCDAKGRCSRELKAGTAAMNARDFCPNAETFAALS